MQKLFGTLLMTGSATVIIGVTVALANRLGATGSAFTGLATGAIAGTGSASVVMGSSRKECDRVYTQTQRTFTVCQHLLQTIETRVATLEQGIAGEVESLQDGYRSLEKAITHQKISLKSWTHQHTSNAHALAPYKRELGELRGELRSRIEIVTGRHISYQGALSVFRQEVDGLRDELGSRTEWEQQRFQIIYQSVVNLQKVTEEELSRLQDRYRSLQETIGKELDDLRDEFTSSIEKQKPQPSIKTPPTLPLTEPKAPGVEEPTNASSRQSTPEALQPEPHDLPEIRDWLAGHDITIKNWAKPKPIDSDLDHLSDFIGENYAVLENVIHYIKVKTLGYLKEKDRRDFTKEKLKQFNVFEFYNSEAEKAILTSFGNKLKHLSWYNCTESYKPSNRILYKPLCLNDRSQEILKFFTSTWLERYAFLKIAEVLREHNLHFEGARDLVAAPNWKDQRKFELDVLYLIEGNPLWIECKAWKDPTENVADLTHYLNKYSSYRERLGIAKAHALALVLNLDPNQDKALSLYQNFSVVRLQALQETLRDIASTWSIERRLTE